MLELTAEPLDKLERRFLKHVEKTDTCWLWKGAVFGRRYGYGQFSLHRIDKGRFQPTRAHRVAYALWVQDVSRDQVVAHRCDRPACVRPDHLFLTDQPGNLADMRSKGRHYTKLTSEQVLEIRRRFDSGERPYSRIAADFGVDGRLITAIGRREKWAHL